MKLGLSTESCSEKGKLRSADGQMPCGKEESRETRRESKRKRDSEKVSASSRDLHRNPGAKLTQSVYTCGPCPLNARSHSNNKTTKSLGKSAECPLGG